MSKYRFKCSCGSPAETVSTDAQPWSHLAGYGNRWGSWHSTPESARDLVPNPPLGLREKCPGVGETHWLRITHPFAGTTDERFWCFYEPPMIRINGSISVSAKSATWHSFGAELLITLAWMKGMALRRSAF
jgi:hypothetical protein